MSHPKRQPLKVFTTKCSHKGCECRRFESANKVTTCWNCGHTVEFHEGVKAKEL